MVREYAAVARFPLLWANGVDAAAKPAAGKPFTILTVGRLRVALIGVVIGGRRGTPKMLGPWRALHVPPVIREYVKGLRKR